MHVKKKPIDVLTFLSKEKFLFIVILFIEFFQFLYCIGSNRLVVHDTFFRFYMQYYYLNNYINYFEYPYWIPYLTHGTLATPWQGLVGIHGILNNTLFLTGNILKNFNFLPIFYTGVFFDKLVLLIGSWLLTKRLYGSPFVSFIVCTSILISSVWASQVHLNFLFYYAIPLILYLFHRFIETQQWRYLLLGSNLFVLQCIDKLFYFLPVVSLTIFLYFFFYIGFNFRETLNNLKKLKFGLRSSVCIILILCSILVVVSLVKSGMEGEIVKNVYRRNTDGSVPLNIFLTYAQDNSLTKWMELFWGISIKNDTTLYCGLLIPVFAIFGFLFSLNRKSIPVLLTCLILFLFSLGSTISIFFYHCWPTMKYYRHIFQIVSIVRLFLCLFAGFGLLKLLEYVYSTHRPKTKTIWLFLSAIVLFCLGIILYCKSADPRFITTIIKPLIYDADLNQIMANSQHYSRLLKFIGIKYIFFSFLFFLFIFTQKRARLEFLLLIFIFLQIFDGYIYSFSEFNNRTVPLSTKQLQTTQFQPIIFNHHRSTEDFNDTNQRQNILTPELLSKSLLSWNIQAFLFNDPVETQLRTDHWLKPYDQYVKVFSRNNHNPSEAEEKFSGVTENKIQFYEHAYIADLQTTAGIISNPEFPGDILFLESERNKLSEDKSLAEWHGQASLTTNERAHLSYQTTFFSSNRLGLFVDNPTNKHIWLFYSDVWHPYWKAKVNNISTHVYKANIAYKAVKLNPGLNEVRFYFSSPLWKILTFLIIINSFIWLCYIIYLFKSVLSRNE